MSVDLSKIKPGDEVTVRCVVEAVKRDALTNWPVRVFLNGAHDYSIDGHGNVRAESIASHTPRALAVGDRVRLAGTTLYRGSEAELAATDGLDGWVRMDDGSHYTVDLSDLERVS